MSFTDFHFLRPLWLLALPVAAMVLFVSAKGLYKTTSWERVIDAHLLPYLLEKRKNQGRTFMQGLWLSLFMMLVVVALAGPTLQKKPSEIGFYQAPLIICLEMSEHMMAKDISPTRLKRALFKLEDLLQTYKGAETALIAFAGDAHVVVPLSNDPATVMSMAKNLSPDIMPIKGANLESALAMAADMTKSNPHARVIVMTSSNFADVPAQRLAKLAQPFTIWAFATETGAPLERDDGRFDQGRGGQIVISKLRRDRLMQLATSAQVATVMFSADNRDIGAIVKAIASTDVTRAKRDVLYDEWYDLGPYVLALAMVFFLGGVFFARDLVLMASFLLMVPSPPAKAGVLDWFLRRDQQAERALSNNEPAKAAELYQDDFHKGAAHYRAKDYDAAIKHLSGVNTADGRYNLGNALAQKGQYQEAIAAYDEALKLDPANEDAKANKELLQRAQKEQKQKEEEKKSQKEDGEPSSEEKTQPSSDKSEQNQAKDQSQGEPSAPNQQEQADKAADKKSQEKTGKKSEQKPPSDKEKAGDNKAREATGEPPKDKLDPESQYHFQRLEQRNSDFLKRKFRYESQKRQEGK